jgi:TolB-like protein
MEDNYMRKLLFVALIALLCCSGKGGKSDAGSSGDLDLDSAIKQAAQEINDALPGGSKVALLNFTSESNLFSEYVLEEMSIELVKNRKLVVVDRKELDLIRTEKNFQWSGEVDDKSAQEIGKLLGAQTIVSGSLMNMGKNYRFRTKAINVESAAIETSSSVSVKSDSQVQHLLSQGGKTTTTPSAQGGAQQRNVDITIVNNTGNTIDSAAYCFSGINPSSEDMNFLNLGGSLRNGASKKITLPPVNMSRKYNFILADTNEAVYIKWEMVFTPDMTITFTSSDKGQTAASAAPATPAARAYKIGDTGPAGGLIFYDKGNNSGGWRYLEAAPVEAEFRAVWNVRDVHVDNTQPNIGTGRRNTQVIVEKFSQTSGEWDTAAQKADDLVYKGFDDWFMPSKDELDQMYGNLKRKNLGDFKNEWYWSSTEISQGYSHFQNFQDGRMTNGDKQQRQYVRPIRQVAGQ